MLGRASLRPVARTLATVRAAVLPSLAARRVAPALVATTTAPAAATVATAAAATRSFARLSALSPSHISRRSTSALPRLPVRTSASYTTKTEGVAGTKEWRMYFYKDGKKISPWHEIPLYPTAAGAKDVYVTYINEIPKGSRPKMEIGIKERMNPLKQDIKKGALRNFTYGDLPFNYGSLPQTWEDPTHAHKDTGCVGDNDPLDVVELSNEPMEAGAVVTVRILGLLALIDEGETDWKILAISQKSKLYDQLLDSDDLETFFPKTVEGIRDWFRNYKTTDGKPQNRFAFDEKMRGQAYAMRVVSECHASWQHLTSGKAKATNVDLTTSGAEAPQSQPDHSQ